MMSYAWHKIWLVMRREYTFNFRRPSFLFTAFGVPLLSIGTMFLVFQFAISSTNPDNWTRIATIDRADVIIRSGITRDGEPIETAYVPYTDSDIERPADEAALPAYFDALEESALAALKAGELDAYLVIPDHYIYTGQVDLFAKKNVPEGLRSEVQDFMRAQIAGRVPDDLLVSPQWLADPDITLRDTEGGEELSETQIVGRFLLPFLFVMVYFMATSTTAQFLMSGVVEEKENRLMEILATTLQPSELLWGKMLGLGALALTQVVLWMGGGLLISQIHDGAREFMTSVSFAPGDLALLAVLFVINFLLFSASMLALGAAVTAEAESRQIAGVFTLIAVLPLALISLYFLNPNGIVPMIFTFFPFTGAVSLILRMAFTTLPTWQIAVSLAIQVVSVFVVMWLAAKVFRLGMLMYGKRLTPRALWQALREGRQVLTTASVYDEAGQPARKQQKKGWLRR